MKSDLKSFNHKKLPFKERRKEIQNKLKTLQQTVLQN